MRHIQRVASELEAVHVQQDKLFRQVATVSMKAIHERSNHHSQLNPFGIEMRNLDALMKSVHRPARPELMVKEKTVHSLAEDANSNPRAHGLIFFVRVMCNEHFEQATGLNTRKWRQQQDDLAYKAAVLSVELQKLKEVASGRRENVEVVRV